MSRIRSWALEQHPLPETDLGKAIAYMMEMWKGLTAFLDDARIPLDNNAAELDAPPAERAAPTTDRGESRNGSTDRDGSGR